MKALAVLLYGMGNMSFSMIGRLLGVSDVAVLKWGFCCNVLALVAGHLRDRPLSFQAATLNNPAMNFA
jgi:hypothetical protein